MPNHQVSSFFLPKSYIPSERVSVCIDYLSPNWLRYIAQNIRKLLAKRPIN